MTQPTAEELLADPRFYETTYSPRLITMDEPEPVLTPSQSVVEDPFQ